MTQLYELFSLLTQTEQGAGNMVGALKTYRASLAADPDMLNKIQSGEMVKTLTILSDGNLWCSNCGRESCNVSLHAKAAAEAKSIVEELREIGIIVNAIGFTEQSRPVVAMFDQKDSTGGSAVVVSDITRVVAVHHGQMVKSWQVIQKAAEHRLENQQ